MTERRDLIEVLPPEASPLNPEALVDMAKKGVPEIGRLMGATLNAIDRISGRRSPVKKEEGTDLARQLVEDLASGDTASYLAANSAVMIYRLDRLCYWAASQASGGLTRDVHEDFLTASEGLIWTGDMAGLQRALEVLRNPGQAVRKGGEKLAGRLGLREAPLMPLEKVIAGIGALSPFVQAGASAYTRLEPRFRAVEAARLAIAHTRMVKDDILESAEGYSADIEKASGEVKQAQTEVSRSLKGSQRAALIEIDDSKRERDEALAALKRYLGAVADLSQAEAEGGMAYVDLQTSVQALYAMGMGSIPSAWKTLRTATTSYKDGVAAVLLGAGGSTSLLTTLVGYAADCQFTTSHQNRIEAMQAMWESLRGATHRLGEGVEEYMGNRDKKLLR